MTSARRYHEVTKHFPGRPSSNPYGLEWRNEPDLFKRYSKIQPEPPPEGSRRALRRHATRAHPFHPGEGSVRLLRNQDVRAAFARAAAARSWRRRRRSWCSLALTAWKYGPRGWPHVFWDAGAMLANLMALADETRLHPRLFIAFADAEVALVLGVEPPEEAPLALLALGHGRPASLPGALPPVRHEVVPLSPREHRFPEAELTQAASELATEDEVRAWREATARFGDRRDGGQPPAQLDRVILRRGSARDFTFDSIDRDELAAALRWTGAEVPVDLPRLCSAFVIAHAVEGLAPGAR